MAILKWLFFKYQRALWYAGQAKSEYGKIGSWIPETLMLLTYLTVNGFKVQVWHIVIAYIILIILAALIGKFFVVIGVTKYTTSLGNEHNPELTEVLERIKKIESKL